MNLLTLSGKLQLDKKGYDDGLDQAEKRAEGSSSKIGKLFGGLTKATVAGITASSAAILKITKDSIQEYAQFQQLSGGIEKLYGNMGKTLEEYAAQSHKSVDEVRGEWQKLENAQNTMLDNAKNAFKTAGMSANDYMQNVTGFSAALINSLGGDTEKAAQVADMAMRDIADNANTFGTLSAQELAQVYQALAKGQYQTLDNLNLGFGGTKEGMQKLIDKANELGKAQGLNSNLTIDSYADIVEAIHRVQGELNITGTTEKEAMKTIEGSFNKTKAAWQNLVTGFADPKADIGKLVGDLVTSASYALGNLVPAVEQALGGIGEALTKIGPILIKEAPKLIINLIPGVLKAGTQFFTSIVQIIPQLFKDITKMMNDAWPEIARGIDDLFNSIFDAIGSFTEGDDFITPFLHVVANILDRVTENLLEGLPQIATIVANLLKDAATWIQDGMPYIVETGANILAALIDGIIGALPILIDSLPVVINTLVNTILEWAPAILEMGTDLVMRLIDGLVAALPNLIKAMGDILVNLVKSIIEHLPDFLSSAIRIVTTLQLGLIKAIPSLIKAAGELIKAVWNTIKATDWIKLGKNVIKGIVQGLKDAGHMIADFLLKLMDGAVDKVKKFFGIHSPSRKMREEIGKQIPAGMALGIEDNADMVTEAMKGLQQIPEDFDPEGFNPTNPTGGRPGSAGAGAGGASSTYIINVNQPVSTPDEMARAIRLESQFGLIEGAAL